MSHPSSQLRAALHAVGCKLNQYENQVWAQAFRALGYQIVPFDSEADVYVLNTCAVTSRTDRECRRLARSARRRNPQALIVLTGCYVDVDSEALVEAGLADLLLPRAEKPLLVARVDARIRGTGVSPSALPLLEEFTGHTRAFLKVQEGCAGGCTYCVIPRARGPESSVPSQLVIEQARLLARRHPELVLIGTHLGRYGRDLPGETTLAGLVERLTALPELGRLRLSSLEPLEVTPELIALLAAGKLCRHLHLPLQSGCDSVLARMNRPYDTAAYAELLAELERRVPGVCLGADVMVGFPGETETEFAQTLAFLERVPLAHLHVFTYSPRPGTAAAQMPGQLAGHLKKERNHVLRALAERKRQAFAATQVGKRLQVVLETHAATGEVYGLSDNYLEVALDGAVGGRCLTLAEITRAEGDRLHGRLVPADLPGAM
ncbi:MAG: tRNA (N(6)-L-threonylcarbamoyladenosine(37)-C(2))-methylthiotransferase MtaB [candidate division WS1 bacterium]|nr:tRNA (N(6)-L-threonylcarbamoyladenosine(37)-C(2))-methylthiotransferase MtaB [candidate division WS1 bacterium]